MDRGMNLHHHLGSILISTDNEEFVKNQIQELRGKTIRLSNNIKQQEKIAYQFSENLKGKTIEEIEDFIKCIPVLLNDIANEVF
jgi:hypothetical protein